MTSPRHAIQQLARQFEAEDNAAFDLWSWLPSHKAAKKAHGDYADEHRPELADLMKEAAMYFAYLKGHEHTQAEIEEWFGCPCKECAHAKGVLP